MLNSGDTLRCKYQLKQIAKIREKNIAANEKYILRKMGKFQTPSFIILREIASRNKQKWLNEELLIWSRLPKWKGGTSFKNYEINLKKISDRLELSQPAFTIPSQPGKDACPLP